MYMRDYYKSKSLNQVSYTVLGTALCLKTPPSRTRVSDSILDEKTSVSVTYNYN